MYVATKTVNFLKTGFDRESEEEFVKGFMLHIHKMKEFQNAAPHDDSSDQ